MFQRVRQILSCFLSLFEEVFKASGIFSCGGRCAGILAPAKTLWCGCWCSISSLPCGGRCEAWFVNLCPRCSYRMCSDSCGPMCLLPQVWSRGNVFLIYIFLTATYEGIPFSLGIDWSRVCSCGMFVCFNHLCVNGSFAVTEGWFFSFWTEFSAEKGIMSPAVFSSRCTCRVSNYRFSQPHNATTVLVCWCFSSLSKLFAHMQLEALPLSLMEPKYLAFSSTLSVAANVYLVGVLAEIFFAVIQLFGYLLTIGSHWITSYV